MCSSEKGTIENGSRYKSKRVKTIRRPKTCENNDKRRNASGDEKTVDYECLETCQAFIIPDLPQDLAADECIVRHPDGGGRIYQVIIIGI